MRLVDPFAQIVSARHEGCIIAAVEVHLHMLQSLISRPFWDNKIKIAILALATYMAMC